MTVTFIAHSGFLVEWDRFYTLFDYWKGDLPTLRADKPLLVFVSHNHEDHFNPAIFALLERYPDTQFFLSRDVSMTQRRREKLGVSDEAFARVTILRPDVVFATEAAGEELTIRTVKSTDAGVAYLLSSEEKLVYHAGDCNWWHWESEGEAYCGNMAALYARAMEKLTAAVRDEAEDHQCAPRIDAAMVPLDPRLEDAYAMGAEKLLSCVAVEKLFPMHLWEKFDTIARYRAEYPQHADIVVPITRNGEAFPL